MKHDKVVKSTFRDLENYDEMRQGFSWPKNKQWDNNTVSHEGIDFYDDAMSRELGLGTKYYLFFS